MRLTPELLQQLRYGLEVRDGVRTPKGVVHAFTEEDRIKARENRRRYKLAQTSRDQERARAIVAESPGITTEGLMAAFNASRVKEGLPPLKYTGVYRHLLGAELRRTPSRIPGRKGCTRLWWLSQAITASDVLHVEVA